MKLSLKHGLRISAATLCILTACTLAACSDDDSKNVEPAGGNNSSLVALGNVFKNGYPKAFGNARFTTDDKGRLTEIRSGSGYVTFTYGDFMVSRSNNFSVMMKFNETDDPDEGSTVYLEINDLGYASYAEQVFDDSKEGIREWWFGYDGEGQLNSVRRTRDRESFEMTYAHGDLTRVVETEADGDRSEYTFEYTDLSNPLPVDNKGCMTLYDRAYHVDLDEMEFIYFAGMLGNATRHLPIGYTATHNDNGLITTETATYTWTLNSAGYPTKFAVSNDPTETVSFAW